MKITLCYEQSCFWLLLLSQTGNAGTFPWFPPRLGNGMVRGQGDEELGRIVGRHYEELFGWKRLHEEVMGDEAVADDKEHCPDCGEQGGALSKETYKHLESRGEEGLIAPLQCRIGALQLKNYCHLGFCATQNLWDSSGIKSVV